jgi:hypothetical protein
MLTRLLFAVTLVLVFASPAAGKAHHGGSGIVGATRVGDLRMDVSTEADVRAFAGNPNIIDDDLLMDRGIVRLGYNCRKRDECQTDYQIDRHTDTLFGFATDSKRFRTRHGTRVGDTRKRAERRERRKAFGLCGGGTRAIDRVQGDHYLWILFDRRRVFELVVDSTFVEC